MVGGRVVGASVATLVVATTVVGVAVVGVVVEAAGRVVVTASVDTGAGSVAGVDESDDAFPLNIQFIENLLEI